MLSMSGKEICKHSTTLSEMVVVECYEPMTEA